MNDQRLSTKKELISKLSLILILTLLWSIGCPPSSLAVPADPTARVELTQPDGFTKLTVRPVGDERNGRLETLDGYTVVKDADGWYHYASLDSNGDLVPSGVKVGSADQLSAAQSTVLSQIQPGLAATSDRLTPRVRVLEEPQRQALTSRAPQTTNNVLIIVIDFPDDSYTFPSSNFDNLMNQSGYDGYGSVNDFFEEISYGQFSVNGVVTQWYTAANNRAYYGYNDDDNWVAAAELAKEAIIAARDDGVDFAPFDNSGDGYVDGLFIVHAGPGAEAGYTGYPWSHAWSLTWAGVGAVTASGKTVDGYTMEPEKRNSAYMVRIGVFCHEYGHALGLPDLYDTDYSSIGVGDWCLMAGGSWNGPVSGGRVPAHMSAWCKIQLGWMSPVNVTEDMLGMTLLDAETYPTCYRVWDSGSVGQEYFLVEYRNQILFDQYLPGCGVAIWHVDEAMPGNSNDLHRLVDLEEQDMSENNSPGDVWLDGVFGPSTFPNSDSYYGSSTAVEITTLSTTCLPGGLVVDLAVGIPSSCYDPTDTDSDNVGDSCDNCPLVANEDQTDADGDEYGAACDCNDLNPNINPLTVWYEDADSDGFGNPAVTLTQCEQPDGYVQIAGDCDDTNGDMNPLSVWYYDADSDGFGEPGGTAVTQCQQPGGYVLNDDDNCVGLANPLQEDTDNDSVGDSCDNCIDVYNPDQADSNGDNEGDLCECCIGLTGNVDYDGEGIIDIGDLTELISYLFIPPVPELACLETANVDGDLGGVIDIGDLTALISYLFIPPNETPAPCL